MTKADQLNDIKQQLATMRGRAADLAGKRDQSKQAILKGEADLGVAMFKGDDETAILETIASEREREKGYERAREIALKEISGLERKEAQLQKETLYEKHEADLREAFGELSEIVGLLEQAESRFRAIELYAPDGFATRDERLQAVAGMRGEITDLDLSDWVSNLRARPFYRLIDDK